MYMNHNKTGASAEILFRKREDLEYGPEKRWNTAKGRTLLGSPRRARRNQSVGEDFSTEGEGRQPGLPRGGRSHNKGKVWQWAIQASGFKGSGSSVVKKRSGEKTL